MPSSPTDPASTAYPQDSAVSPAAVVTEVLAEQARRWRSGMPEPVEDWLRRHPLLRDNADAVLDLIYQEVLLRTEQGERPALEEYQGRFPSHAAALATLFEVHQAVEAGGEVGAESSLAESAWRTRLTLRDGMAPRAESPHAELLGAGLMSAPHVPGFEIVEQLGRGGMGVVYRARQLSLGRTVALKMVLAGAQARPEELTRLRREAEALARVPHPNIVQIHEIGEHGGGPYLALEFVEGGSLDRKLAGAPQPADAAARLVETLARAVEHAHRQGIIHRDLKPANVLLAADGTPKITDFGLARLGDRSGETRTGDVLGTPSYMAPEQAAGRAADIGPGADVYALGAILYELLTGRPPFRADNALETLRQVLEQEPVPPARLQASVPRDLDTICLKCLEKDRRRRYATAGALADDLQCFRERRPVLARPAPAWERGVKWARRRPALAALYSVAVVATVVLGLYTAWLYDALTETEKQRGVAQKARNDAESAAESRRQQLVRAHLADGARLLDDGDWHGALVPLAQALQLDDDDAARANAASAHIHRVRLAAILRQCPRLVCFWPHAGDVVLAELTPDGRHAVTAADRAVQVWDVAGGAEIKRMDHGATIRAAAVSPDGLRMATAAADRTVRVWETATGRLLAESAPLHDPLLRVAFGSAGRILIVTRKGIDAVEVHAWDAADDQTAALLLQTKTGPAFDLAVSPDGRRAATEHQGVVTVWDLESGAAVFTAGDGKSTLTAARFNPSGDVLAAADVSGAVRIWDVSLGAAGRELALIRPPGRPVRQLAFSVGNNLATGETDGVARVWSAGGKKQADLKHGAMFTHAVDCVAFSADGRRVVTAGVDKTARVWTADNAGAPLLWHGERVTAASFSPDCRLLLTVCAGGIVRIWDLAAGRLATPPLAHDDFISHAAFSEDGRRAATAGDDRTVRLWDLTTGKPHRKPLVHAFPVRQVSFGADCQVLTVAGDYSQGDGEACVWNAQGERKFHRATAQAFRGIVPTDRTVKRAWFSRDGRHVLTVNQTGIAQVWDTVTGQPTTEPLAHPSAVTGAAFSPDRRRVLTHTFLHAPAISVWEGAGRPLAELFRQVDPDNTVVVWDVAGGKPVARLGEPKSTTPYRHASFSPDGASLLVIDGTAHVWDIAAQQARRRFQKPGTAVVQAALDPAGRTLVTLSADRTAQLWDADEGSLIPTPGQFRHNDPVWPPQFSSDGRLLALGGPGGVRIWDAKTGDPVSPPLLQPGIVYSAAFSPDGDRLLTASDRAARLWPLTPASESAQDLLELAQFLSCTRLDRQAGHVAPMSRDELCAAWKKLRGKFSAHFTTPTSDVIAWHADEARMCERSQNKIGAALHRQRLRQAGGD